MRFYKKQCLTNYVQRRSYYLAAGHQRLGARQLVLRYLPPLSFCISPGPQFLVSSGPQNDFIDANSTAKLSPLSHQTNYLATSEYMNDSLLSE